jgi:diacylglycerol kinase family enzyme
LFILQPKRSPQRLIISNFFTIDFIFINAPKKKIAEICEAKDLDYSIRISGAPGRCCKIAREAAESGREYRIYACGGDGTLNEVVNGAVGFDNVAVTTFAGGSGNDFARMFSDPAAFRDLERLLDAEVAEFDLIKCNDDYSLNICSVGLDARIGHDVTNYKRLPLLSGFRAYALSVYCKCIDLTHPLPQQPHRCCCTDGETYSYPVFFVLSSAGLP